MLEKVSRLLSAIQIFLGHIHSYIYIYICVTHFGKTCLNAEIIFSDLLSITTYLSCGASFDATLTVVVTI